MRNASVHAAPDAAGAKATAAGECGGGLGEALRSAMVEVPGGAVTLGLSSESEDFGWDNEFEAHTVEVPGFAIDKYKVTNGQYLEFMEAGGYDKRDLWSEADCQWRVAQNITHPAFWNCGADGWLYRGMFEETALPLDGPVYVSHAEASAYARWAGKKLPTEAQWQRAAIERAER